jgi:hypothetical protein
MVYGSKMKRGILIQSLLIHTYVPDKQLMTYKGK